MDHISEPRERRNMHLVCRRWNIYLRHLAWRKIVVEDGERAGKLIEVLLANESLCAFVREIRFPGPNSMAYVSPGTEKVLDPSEYLLSEEIDHDMADTEDGESQPSSNVKDRVYQDSTRVEECVKRECDAEPDRGAEEQTLMELWAQGNQGFANLEEDVDQVPADLEVEYFEDYAHDCDVFCVKSECVRKREVTAEERLEVFSRVAEIALHDLDEAVLQELREGIASPTSVYWICLLLVLLPNLRRIGFCQEDFQVEGFFQIIHWMSQSSKRATKSTTFEKLEEVSILSGWSTCYSPSTMPMFWLPNLKVLRLCDINFDSTEFLGGTFQPLLPPTDFSSIRELHLSTGFAMTDDIPEMIVACKRLEVFSLQFEERKKPERWFGFDLYPPTDISIVFNIREICQALLKHKDSLRQLRFNEMGNVGFWQKRPAEPMQLGSLKEFSNLEDLEIQTVHLMHADFRGEHRRFVDLLPRSLRNLTLTRLVPEVVEAVERNIHSMLACRQTEFPLWKTFVIENPPLFHPPYNFKDWGHDFKCKCFVDKMSTVRDLCDKKGVELTILDVDTPPENSYLQTYQHVC